LLEAAKAQGQSALAITDHGTMSGHRDFQREAKNLGMKPVLGLEAYISPTTLDDRRPVAKRDDNTKLYNHIILLAKDANGYRNLSNLSEIAWTQGFYSKPRIDRAVLAENRDGLIVLSGCMTGLISKAIENGNEDQANDLTRWFKETFEENFYMEIQPHNPVELNMGLLELADRFNIRPVVTGDCHYAKEEDRWREEAMLILSTGPNINRKATYESAKAQPNIFARLNHLYPDRAISFQDIDVFVTSEDQIAKALRNACIDRADVIENTARITDSVGEYDYHEKGEFLPRPKTDNPSALLRKKAYEGLKRRGLHESKPHVDQLNVELKVFSDLDFDPYIIMVANAVSWAKKQGIRVGPGRGSAAGSVVCYALDITDEDPLAHNLLFFRFVNPERMAAGELPDIDIDFEDRRRNEVKEYARRQYKDVASIATFGRFQGKNSVKDASRVFNVPLGDVNRALKAVHTDPAETFFDRWEATPAGKKFKRDYPEVVGLAQFLHGRIRQIGVHAGGLIVSREPINQYAPIQTVAEKGNPNRVPLVALDMEDVAGIGFVKQDFLGLKSLSVIEDTVRLIKERHGIEIDTARIPRDDARVYKMLSEGYTKGVFQCEQPAYTGMLIKMGGVKNFDELAASNALVRPGAMDSTAGAAFIARKNGRQTVQYHHPDMVEFTKETYGTIIYQEQVMLTMTELAGMSMGTADKVRKIIGKKRDVREFEQYKEEFVEGASRKVSRLVAEKLWHDFEAHANYSFNKSHAVVYSLLSYWTAWFKVNYPIEFMASVLSNEGEKESLLDYLIETKRLGIEVMLPHINRSGVNFEIQQDGDSEAIRFGLSNIKNISDTGARRLIDRRPFSTYNELYEIVMAKGSGLNARMLQGLNAVGGAAFRDNPRTGNERENFYEYLNIPAFEHKVLPPSMVVQFRPLDEFDPTDAFVSRAMVRSIKTGPGWARLDLVDESGTAGVFTDENTPIESGNMYVFLIANNRVARYVSVNDLSIGDGSEFEEFLKATEFPDIPDSMVRVVSFRTRKTKAGKLMADAVFADNQKELMGAMIFPQQYHKAFGKCKEGAVVDVQFDETQDGSIFVRNVL